MNDEILNIIESARKSHNNKQALFLEKYIDYYNMPIKNNVILYESFAGAGMIDSPYAIFLEFLHNKKFDDYIHVWVINNFENNKAYMHGTIYRIRRANNLINNGFKPLSYKTNYSKYPTKKLYW